MLFIQGVDVMFSVLVIKMAHSVRHFFCPRADGYWVSRPLSDELFCADSDVAALPAPVDTTTG
jgi:hypothetical protein